MAWDIIPDTPKKCANAVKKCMTGNEAEGKEVMKLWRHLKKMYPDEKDPLAFSNDEADGKKKVKVARIISKKGYGKGAKGEKALAEEAGIDTNRFSWGDGSRKGRGKGNQGNKFEDHLVQAINLWVTEGEKALWGSSHDESIKAFVMQMATIYDVDYSWWNNRKLVATNMGGNDTKRPLKLKDGTWYIGSAGGGKGYDIGEKVSDVTVMGDKGPTVFISAKTSGTTALVNLGVRTNYFPIKDIQASNIKLAAGQALLNTFGLDEKKFCKVFNDFDAGLTFSESATAGSNFDSGLLEELVKGSLGYGFHYVHKMGKGSNSKIWHKRMTEKFLNSSCVPNKSSIKIQYGGTSGEGAKRVDIFMSTPTLELQFNIRNTSGKSTKDDPNATYPTHLQAGYKFNGETKESWFWEAADDSYSGKTTGKLNELESKKI
tara:strand:- start:656 stop:1948 length:1293 start_codon:yes stop_codon:yes gene_type:complete